MTRHSTWPSRWLMMSILFFPIGVSAETFNLEEACNINLSISVWDETTSTCTFSNADNYFPDDGDVLIIKGHETLLDGGVSRLSLPIVFNSGSIVINASVLSFNSLVNTGSLVINTSAGVAALSDGNGISSLNAGVIINSGLLFTLGNNAEGIGLFENRGRVINNGILENYTLIENHGHIQNGSGLIRNSFDGGVINNYRCAGSVGVVTADAGNIENSGEINFINGKDC